tara:strand:- start:2070 stop:2705 length:636 start_codon:yes stop_codon:yes gene_type:complete
MMYRDHIEKKITPSFPPTEETVNAAFHTCQRSLLLGKERVARSTDLQRGLQYVSDMMETVQQLSVLPKSDSLMMDAVASAILPSAVQLLRQHGVAQYGRDQIYYIEEPSRDAFRQKTTPLKLTDVQEAIYHAQSRCAKLSATGYVANDILHISALVNQARNEMLVDTTSKASSIVKLTDVAAIAYTMLERERGPSVAEKALGGLQSVSHIR